MKRVIGLGGIMFKSKDPKTLIEWYKKHLGLAIEDYGGTIFMWDDATKPGESRYSVWSVSPENSKYYEPGKSSFMVNFIVEDLYALLDVLKTEGVQIIGEPMDSEYGKFGWVIDPDGNKIELWQPK